MATIQIGRTLIEESVETVLPFDITSTKDGKLVLGFDLERGEYVRVFLDAYETAQLGSLVAAHNQQIINEMHAKKLGED